MHNDTDLRMTSGARAEMLRLAASEPTSEIVGLLGAQASEPNLVCTLCLLPAAATGSSATATGKAIREAIERLQTAEIVPVGVFHSHAQHPVFCSSTDERMIERLFPTLAAACMKTLAPVLEPQILGDDQVQVATRNGWLHRASLHGSEIGGGYECAAWTFSRLEFHDQQEPHIRYLHSTIEMVGERTTLVLGIPDASTVEMTTTVAPHRAATLHSVVVNAKGDLFVEAVKIVDINGQILADRRIAGLESVGSANQTPSANEQFILYREATSCDVFGRTRGVVLTEVWGYR